MTPSQRDHATPWGMIEETEDEMRENGFEIKGMYDIEYFVRTPLVTPSAGDHAYYDNP